MLESVQRYNCDACNEETEEPDEITTIKLETASDHPELPNAPDHIAENMGDIYNDAEVHICEDCADIDTGNTSEEPKAYICTETGTIVAMIQKGDPDITSSVYLSKEGASGDWEELFNIIEGILDG